MNRRRLLQLGATLFAAPAIVRAESLMRVCLVPNTDLWLVGSIENILFLPGPKYQISQGQFYDGGFTVEGWVRHEPGIITPKRPNYSHTRLWPESD